MYRTILVGYDGREGSRDALALARGLAAIEGAELVLLRGARARSARHARRRLRARDGRGRGAALGRGPRECSARRRSGSARSAASRAPRALHEVAEDERADVIVLGSTHREGLGRVLPGQRRRAPAARGAVRGAGRAERVRRARHVRDRHDRRRLRRPHRGRARARGRRRRSPPTSARRSRRSRHRTEHEPAIRPTVSWSSARASSTCWSSARAATARSATRCSAASPGALMRGSACPVLVVPRTAG